MRIPIPIAVRRVSVDRVIEHILDVTLAGGNTIIECFCYFDDAPNSAKGIEIEK